MAETTGRTLIVILGPTAVGKTGLAIELAQIIGGEIINADSRQIYRYMDIGTAKPTPQQRRQVPHHLLDMVDPDETLSLAQYQQMAYAAIEAIHERARVPVLVGGTGQYITAVVEGWTVPEIPPNPALRAELETFAAEHGAETLYSRLREVDPAAAENIDYRNVRRVIRALEVYQESGQPISELQRKKPPDYPILQIGLTLDRSELYNRADRRVDEMIAHGFVDEVRWLLDKGYDRTLPSMSGLGYRELAAHLLDGIPLAEAVAATQIATHDFIRRQYTWFRGHDSGILWHNMREADGAALIRDTAGWLQKQV